MNFKKTLILSALFALLIVSNSANATKKEVKSKKANESQEPSAPNEPNINQWEIRTAPLAFLARWLTLESLYRLDDHWAIGASYVAYRATGGGGMFTPFPGLRGNSFGLVVTRYFHPLEESGLYGNLHLSKEDYTQYPNADGPRSLFHYKGHSLLLVAGYRMPFWQHFFILAGAGAKIGMYEKFERDFSGIETTNKNYFGVIGYLEAKLGIAF